MASTSQPHPAFPPRPYTSTANLHGKLPERIAPSSAFSSTAHPHPAAREAARIERERQDRLQREAQLPAAPTTSPSAFSTLSDEQREEVNEAFGLFDLDKDQRIDYHEFKVALKALGFDLPKSEIVAWLTTYGIPPENYTPPAPYPPQLTSRTGQQQQQQQQQQPPPVPASRLLLTLSAFQAIAGTLISQRDPRDEILRAFALFDADGKGMISLEDLRRVARELGEGLEEDELVAMIEEFDLEGKGGVGREEFVQICMG